MRSRKNLLLTLLFAAALLLRVAGIKLGLPSETGGLTTIQPDESVTFSSLEKMNPSKLDFYPNESLNWGTFYVYTTGALIKTLNVAGVIKLGNRENLKNSLGEVDKMYLAARAVSAVFGALSVVALYFLGCLFLTRRAAATAAVLMAISLAPVMASALVKTDSTMLFWGLIGVYFSLKLLRDPSTRNYLLAGFFLGLAFITKYSAVLLVFFPFAAHFYHAYAARRPFYGFKKLSVFLLSGLAVFLVCNPYFLLRTSDEIRCILGNAGKGGVGSGILHLYKSYFLSVLPAAFGWSMVPFGLAAVVRWLPGPISEKKVTAIYCALFLLWSGSTSKTYVLYALPVAPFIFLAAGDLAHSIFDRRWGRFVFIAVFAQVLCYTLYLKHNCVSDYTIKEADSWIRQNFPAGSAVAIPKSDTWTPYVIRRRSGSFRVIEGASPQATTPQAVAGLGDVYSKADYVVLSKLDRSPVEGEPGKYPAAYAALRKVFAGTREVKRFEKKLPVYILPFNYGDMDLNVNFMNPEIRVLQVLKK